MIAADSLLHLRRQRKRTVSPSCADSDNAVPVSMTPMDELRQQVSEKRRRVSLEGGSKTVNFQLDCNQYIEPLSSKALKPVVKHACWLCRQESASIRSEMSATVASYRKDLLDSDKDCIRGLEIYVDPIMRVDKQRKSEAFVRLILKQQRLLQSMNDDESERSNYSILSANALSKEQMLARMSATLSQADATEARNLGNSDAEDAFWLYVSTMTAFEQEEVYEQQLIRLLPSSDPAMEGAIPSNPQSCF